MMRCPIVEYRRFCVSASCCTCCTRSSDLVSACEIESQIDPDWYGCTIMINNVSIVRAWYSVEYLLLAVVPAFVSGD